MLTRLLFCWLGGLLVWAWGATAPASRNVVLWVADDLGTELGCYGDPVAQTPNIDRLAREGTRFTHAFCTTASCSASRSVILSGLQNHATGQYGHQHSYHNFHTFYTVRTLPVRLAKVGYRTARIGKFHVQPEEVYRFERVLDRDGRGRTASARNPVQMAEFVREFVAESDPRPFFLYFCTADPHRSGAVRKDSPLRPNCFGNEASHPGVRDVPFDPQDMVVPSFLPDTPECRAELAEYYQAVARVDQGVGRLLEVLAESGHSADTLLILISDNGIAFPGSKTTLYEPGMRLPLIVRAPEPRERAVVCRAMVSWVDLAPTILDYAGVKFEPTEFHGRSFLGILGQEQPPGWDQVFASHTFHEITMYYPMRVIRTRRHKLILNLAHQLPYPFASDLYEASTWQSVVGRNETFYGKRSIEAFVQRPRYELYDLERDPDEIVNQAEAPEYASISAELKQRLKRFQEETQDPWVIKYQYE